MPAGAESARHQPEEDESDREAEREGVLAGEGGEEVPPVDGEARLEEEGEGRRGQAGRPRVAEPCEPPERPRAYRQEEGAEDGHQLEGDVVGDERVEPDGEHPRQREVEGVERESVVPTGVPPGQLPVRQQVRLQRTRGSATCAPVSPPAVVVAVTRSEGCSWLSATSVTPTIATRLAQAGQVPRRVSRRRSGLDGREARASEVRSARAGQRARRPRESPSQKKVRAPKESGATTAATAIRLKEAWATMFIPRRPVR